MAQNLTGQHGINGPVTSLNGQVAKYDQIIKTDDDSDNGVIQSSSNNVKSALGDITSAIHDIMVGSGTADEKARRIHALVTLDTETTGRITNSAINAESVVSISNFTDPIVNGISGSSATFDITRLGTTPTVANGLLQGELEVTAGVATQFEQFIYFEVDINTMSVTSPHPFIQLHRRGTTTLHDIFEIRKESSGNGVKLYVRQGTNQADSVALTIGDIKRPGDPFFSAPSERGVPTVPNPAIPGTQMENRTIPHFNVGQRLRGLIKFLSVSDRLVFEVMIAVFNGENWFRSINMQRTTATSAAPPIASFDYNTYVYIPGNAGGTILTPWRALETFQYNVGNDVGNEIHYPTEAGNRILLDIDATHRLRGFYEANQTQFVNWHAPLKSDGKAVSTEVFPSEFETVTGTSINMAAGHVNKIIGTTSSSAKTYNVNNSLGSDGDIIMLQNSGSGVLTVDNPLSSVDDVVVPTDSTVILRKFTQSNFPYWYHTSVARPTDQMGSGGGGASYAAPDLPSTSVNRTNTTDVTVPSSWVGNINIFTGAIVSGITATVADSIGSDGDFITFRSGTSGTQRSFKIIRSSRTNTPVFGVLISNGELVLHKVEGRWTIYNDVSATAPAAIPFVANTSTSSRTLALSEHGSIAASNTSSNVTWSLPATAPVGWWIIVHKDGNDTGRIRIQTPNSNHHLVGRGTTDYVVDAAQDYIDLEYVNEMVMFIRVNVLGGTGASGWWQTVPLRIKAYESERTRVARSLTTTNTNAANAWIRVGNAVTSTVANRTITIPTTVGFDGDSMVIGNAGTQSIRVITSQWDGTGNTGSGVNVLATDEAASFRKLAGRWYKV